LPGPPWITTTTGSAGLPTVRTCSRTPCTVSCGSAGSSATVRGTACAAPDVARYPAPSATAAPATVSAITDAIHLIALDMVPPRVPGPPQGGPLVTRATYADAPGPLLTGGAKPRARRATAARW